METLSDNVAKIVISQEKQGATLLKLGETVSKQQDMLSQLTKDVDGAKAILGAFSVFSGCAGALAAVVMVYDSRVKKSKKSKNPKKKK